MTPAILSLIALIAAIVLSMTTRVNVGIVGMALAWLVGTYAAHLGADAIMRGFPASLFLTLAGITLLFGLADANGTLERLTHRAVRLARGQARIVPLVFFAIACVVSAVGPGSVAAVAIVAPLAMAVGRRAGVPHFLTALMVANGANAGNLSPISAVGVIANTKMAAAGLGGHEGKVMLANLVASVIVGVAAYVLTGGHRLSQDASDAAAPVAHKPMTPLQLITAGVIVAWIAGVLLLKLNLGLSAFAAATLLVVVNAADETVAVARMPWGVILMVCGVTTLIGVLEVTGGMDLFTTMLSRLATAQTINGVIAFVTGTISIYSSTSGVVLPAFLPTVPGLVQKIGGGDPLAVSLSINVGASLVDVSPLSTLGALCLAAVPDGPQSKRLFRQLLIWGMSMAVVGALLCQLLAGLLARA